MNAFARLVACLLVAACSGGGSGDPPRITLTPDATTFYAGLPMTLRISGGAPPYTISSSAPSVIPSGSAGAQVTILPTPVDADTVVVLTVTDSASTQATLTVTVKPNIVSTSVSLDSPCPPAVCSGTVVTATLSQGQFPLPNRPIKFSVESGDFSITSQDSLTDASGRATAHLQVAPGITSQPARLRVTDTISGFYGSVVLQLAATPVSGPSLFVSPNSLTFSGPNDSACASGQSARVAVIGGVPPYQVLPLQGFTISPSTLGASGQFSVTPNGVCTSGSISVLDAAGNSVSVTVANAPGPPIAVPPPALVVQPLAVELASCTNTATIFFAGGSGAYTASSTNNAVLMSASGNQATLSLNPLPAYPPTVNVLVQSGIASRTVTVKIDPPSCP